MSKEDDVFRGFNFTDDLIEDIHTSEIKYTLLLAKIVDQLKFCINICEDKNLTVGQEDIFKGRKELAESLLELIKSEEVTYE